MLKEVLGLCPVIGMSCAITVEYEKAPARVNFEYCKQKYHCVIMGNGDCTEALCPIFEALPFFKD